MSSREKPIHYFNCRVDCIVGGEESVEFRII